MARGAKKVDLRANEVKMIFQPPLPLQTWKAIEIYLGIAYNAQPPAVVRDRLQALKDAGDAGFYAASVFERAAPEGQTRYSLRLGNQFYPHMKLVIESAPHSDQVFFRPDAHDRHIQLPANSPEAAAFAELTRKNQELATRIEAAWEENGLPTFKQFLREDLARRRAAQRPQI